MNFNIFFAFLPWSFQGSLFFGIPAKIICDFRFTHINIRCPTRHSVVVHNRTNSYFMQNSEYNFFATSSHLIIFIIVETSFSHILKALFSCNDTHHAREFILKFSFYTPWCRVLLEKLTGLQLVKKSPMFYLTWRFITTFTSACHLSLSWASSIQSKSPTPHSQCLHIHIVVMLKDAPPTNRISTDYCSAEF